MYNFYVPDNDSIDVHMRCGWSQHGRSSDAYNLLATLEKSEKKYCQLLAWLVQQRSTRVST